MTTARDVAPELATVAVDIPIGLPDHGPRATDVLARLRLPVGRKPSVFPTPASASTEEPTYLEANAANKEALGKGLRRPPSGSDGSDGSDAGRSRLGRAPERLRESAA